MIPPKYKFYIGRQLEFDMIANTSIDFKNGEYINNIPYALSSYKYSVFSNMLFIDYGDKLNRSLKVYMYSKEQKYLGFTELYEPGVCTFIDNTAYIAIELVRPYSDTDYKEKFNKIYETSKIKPYYKTLSKKYAKENEQEFFRISLDGKINLYGQDYEIIQKSSLDDNLLFYIEKLNVNTNKWNSYFKGQFNKSDCKFDHERKKCELKFTALDKYSNIIDGYENSYNLVKLSPEISKITLYKRAVTQVYIRGAKSFSNFFSGTYWEDDVVEAKHNHWDIINNYHFAYIASANEFEIANAGIADVNGIYAGVSGNWYNWNGYTCYVDKEDDRGGNFVYIKKDSSNEILYKSTERQALGNIDEQDWFINSDQQIVMANIHNSNDTFTISGAIVYHVYQRLLCDVDAITDSSGTKQTYDLPSNDFTISETNYKKCIGLNSGTFYCVSRTVDTPTKYGINDYNKYFTDRFLSLSAGIDKPMPICRSTWANASLWFVYDKGYILSEQRLRKKYTLKDSYSIAAVIKALLNKIDPTIKHEATEEYSHFLYGENMPLSPNRFYIYITQKTNILKAQYDQAAQKAEISLKDIMDMLRDCFRCYWYIDSDNKLKIEHILYFINGGSYNTNSNIQLDFTKSVDQFNKKYTAHFQSEIEFDKSDLNQRYEFNWMDDATEAFSQVTIDVKSKYVQKGKIEDISVNQFSSDIDLMLFNPSNFSNDGFALMCAIKNNGDLELPIAEVELIDENDNAYTVQIQNWYASWAYLASRFYVYDMPAKNISMNILNNIHVSGVKKSMKHSIEFPSAEDLNETELIKTSFGNGKIDEYAVDLNTRMVKVNLVYEPS